MKTISPGNIKNGQSGVVILEALIAVFIFSIGILGLIGTFAASVTNASEAQFRTEAAFLADTLIAQLRVADPNTRATNYASPSGTAFTSWQSRVTDAATGLPGAAKTANLPTVVFAATGEVTVTIHWQAKSDSTTRQYVVVTALE
jgi:type IV pilus assembly protein PilV